MALTNFPCRRFFQAASLALLTFLSQTTNAHGQILAGHVPHAVAASRALTPVAESTRLRLAIGLPLRHQDELDTLLAQIADPESPNYHRYLTPAQFAAEFGPTEADYEGLQRFARENGLTISGTHSNRMLLDVTGTVTEIERVMHVRMMNYEHPVRGRFYAPDREPSIDAPVEVLDISGLDNFDIPHPMSLQQVPVAQAQSYVTGSGPGGYFIGKDFRAAYAPGVTLTGSGQVVGLIEFDGFYAGDVQKNAAAAGVTAPTTQTVLLDGFSGTPGNSNIEVILDIMMAAYMAPGLSKVVVYEGSNGNDILNRMATDNIAQQLSSSWGFSPINATTEQIYKQYAAQGQSMLQASGDSGAYTNGVMPPSDDPNLTVVGGTSLTTAGAGGPWQSETTWSGSGGGVSKTYAIPTWQTGLSMSANHGSTTMRNIPDVALTADIQMYLVQNNGQAVVVGGTSAAAPLWAGFIALANQQAATATKPRLGFLNPLLYGIGKGNSYTTDLNDIKTGNDGGFSAVTGYDLATGWGSPAGQHLINDLTGAAGEPSFQLTSSPSSLSIEPSTPGSAALTISAANGFSGVVSFSIAGLPAGITAVFSPQTTTTSSKVTLTATTAAHAGTYPLTITGVSGSASSSIPLTVTLVTPSFTMASSAGSLTLPRGTSATSTITVAGQGGFNGLVSLSASGLPAGVTASFNPASSSSKSVLTLTASSTAVAGSYSVAVKGVSGALTSSAAIATTVTAPSFTASIAPSPLGVTRGSTATASVTITGQNGFNATVSLSATGLPKGVTATATPASAASKGTITFAAATTAVAGSYPLTINAASGALASSASLTLSVVAASAGTSMVNLAPAYNINALVADGLTFTGGGLDGGLNGSSTAYSANLLGVQQAIGGMVFAFGPANAPDAVSARSIALPIGKFSAIRLLATGVNGGQAAQSFKVVYSDGTSSTFVQNVSDWFTPQNFAGEIRAVTMPYRDNSAGQRDNRTFYLYEYSFPLTSSKTVASLVLPNNRNVVVLAAGLTN